MMRRRARPRSYNGYRRSKINSGGNFRGFRRSPWARKSKDVRMDTTTPNAGEKNYTLLEDHPGTSDEEPNMLMLRKMNLVFVFQYDAGTADPVDAFGGVVEVCVGMAEDATAFTDMLNQADSQGIIKKLCPIVNSAGTCHIWLPRGYDLGGTTTPAGGPLALYAGYDISVTTVTGPAGSALRCNLAARWYGRGYNTRY